MLARGPAKIGFDQQTALIGTPRQGRARLTATTDLPSSHHRAGDQQLLQTALVLHVGQTGRQHAEHLGALAVGLGEAHQALFGSGHGDAGRASAEPSASRLPCGSRASAATRMFAGGIGMARSPAASGGTDWRGVAATDFHLGTSVTLRTLDSWLDSPPGSGTTSAFSASRSGYPWCAAAEQRAQQAFAVLLARGTVQRDFFRQAGRVNRKSAATSVINLRSPAAVRGQRRSPWSFRKGC